ncbi:MAG: antiviral reverse transcriptase Drt2 [Planctomycetota bacterium]
MRDWFRPRPYSHFDSRISRRTATTLVTDPARVEGHAFLPFLSYEKRKRRYKADEHKTVWKPRPIAYAAHADSQIYSYYSSVLSQAYESLVRGTRLDACVLAYRSLGKSNVDHAAEVFEQIPGRTPCTAMAFDVESFFDSLRHDLLRSAWRQTLGKQQLPEDHYRVFRSITRYATVDRTKAYEALGIGKHPRGIKRRRLCSIQEFRELVREAGLIHVREEKHGIPQGSPMSAVLSNIYMHSFDLAMAEAVGRCDGIYRRYSDDILVVCPSASATPLRELVEHQLETLGLRLNSAKTEVTEFPGSCCAQPVGGLQYLGLTFDGTKTLLRSQSIGRFYQRLRRAVRKAERESIKRGSAVLLFKGQLYRRFSHHPGSRSFVRRYALPASTMPGMASIRKQVARHLRVLADEIASAEARIAERAS